MKIIYFCKLINRKKFVKKLKKHCKMKKILMVMACLVLPFVFVGCDDDDDDILGSVTGSMKVTLDGTTKTFTGVGSYQKDGKTYIATISKTNAVTIQLSGTTTGSYTLGLTNATNLSDWTSILTGGIDVSKFENVMTFVPFDNASETYIVVAGECNVTKANSSKVVGTFTGKAIQYKDLSDLSVSSLISMIKNGKDISGSFTAIETSSIADLFDKK